MNCTQNISVSMQVCHIRIRLVDCFYCFQTICLANNLCENHPPKGGHDLFFFLKPSLFLWLFPMMGKGWGVSQMVSCGVGDVVQTYNPRGVWAWEIRAKQIQRCWENSLEKFWVKVLQHKYLWNTLVLEVVRGSWPSYVWPNIVKALRVLRNGFNLLAHLKEFLVSILAILIKYQ